MCYVFLVLNFLGPCNLERMHKSCQNQRFFSKTILHVAVDWIWMCTISQFYSAKGLKYVLSQGVDIFEAANYFFNSINMVHAWLNKK